MKSKTSFFDWTVLKKDIFRFAPVWAVYTILGVLVLSTQMGSRAYIVSENLADSIGALMGSVNCVYGIVAALLLFGDLTNSRLCNALHSLPLRRECWFVTHFVAGILFSLVPNLVLTLMLMPMLEKLWFTAFIWLLGTMLSYLFFYGTAVLAVMCTGTRFGALTVYGLVNFVAIEVFWVVHELILPMLYGVRISMKSFALFSPMTKLWSSYESYFLLEDSGAFNMRFAGFGEGWGYLVGIAVVGIVFSAAALLLYRRRALECAGDFAAIRPVKWVVTIFGSIGCGMVFRIFGFGNDAVELAFLFVGIVVGFFLLQMILQRKIKVFNRKSWICLGALVLAVVLLLILGAVDILGIQRRVPNTARVEKVVLGEGTISPDSIDPPGYYSNGRITLKQPEDIRIVRAIHQELLKEPVDAEEYRTVTILYYLKNGGTLYRTYRVDAQSELFKRITAYFKGEYLFGVADVEEIFAQRLEVEWEGDYLTRAEAETLIRKMWNDAEAGRLSQDWNSHSSELPMTYIWMNWGSRGNTTYRSFTVWEDATETWAYLRELKEKYDVVKIG